MWNLILVRLEIVLALVQDRCKVCTECTIGSETILDVLDRIPR
jgi:NADH:ubiquinone oxidoreductase subunit F (NADH-binding)